MPVKAEVVIVGGGMAGLSCAAALARRGVRNVVLLEAKTLAHARASSFGETRMFREMYSDPVLCRLAQEANRLWRQEEQHAGEPSGKLTGCCSTAKVGMKKPSKGPFPVPGG